MRLFITWTLTLYYSATIRRGSHEAKSRAVAR
jgi:hypothetical protein